MKTTIRKCDNCGYETLFLSDNLKPKSCKRCNSSLEIIAKSNLKEKK